MLRNELGVSIIDVDGNLASDAHAAFDTQGNVSQNVAIGRCTAVGGVGGRDIEGGAVVGIAGVDRERAGPPVGTAALKLHPLGTSGPATAAGGWLKSKNDAVAVAVTATPVAPRFFVSV